MYSYMLRSYFPTSDISKFPSSFISHAGRGIYSTISSYAGGAVYFRSEKVCERVLAKDAFTLIFRVGYSLLML